MAAMKKARNLPVVDKSIPSNRSLSVTVPYSQISFLIKTKMATFRFLREFVRSFRSPKGKRALT